ncbi:MAG: DNA polymerase IV [Defluviitaleaceae bacterium]|nr:DNA polymerase IV [Defluviitaleaceae bacterium]
MDRAILHSDINNFYASVECLRNPEIRDLPVAVGGDEGARHGIVLSKNYHAKKFGIKTAETLVEARQKCRELVTVRANFDLYLKYAKQIKGIYASYTPLTEPYGIDESWLDVTRSVKVYGSGQHIADEIRRRVREIGLTVSVGVSYNKIFAKLASDIVKPDATTLITKENYRDVAWPLPANNMLFVGYETYRKLVGMNILTIGDLAAADEKTLKQRLGKAGLMLKVFANGYDLSPIGTTHVPVKSVGNSNTLPYDVKTPEEVRSAIYTLSESVAVRLRGHGLKCAGVQVYIRDKDMAYCDRQGRLEYPTFIANEIAARAFEVFTEKYAFNKPIRTLGVKGINLVDQFHSIQMDLFGDQAHRERLERAEQVMDVIRERYGKFAILKGGDLANKKLTAGLGQGSETNPLIELFDKPDLVL